MVTASYGHYGQRAAGTGPDSTCRIRLPASVSVALFPKKVWIVLRKTDPDLIWMAWSGFGQTHLVWKQAGVQEPLVPNSGRTPLSDLVTFFHRRPESHCAKPAGSNLVLADCVRFWPNRSGPETNWRPTIIGPASGQCFPANLDQMPIGSGMFTGQLHCCQCHHCSAQ